MNYPVGYVLEEGRIVAIDAFAAMHTPFALHEIPHTVLAAYMSTSMAVAGIHAWALLRGPFSSFHAKALRLAIAMTIPCALLQPVIGHFAGQQVARYQPLKFAAMEQLEETTAGAPIELGPIAVPGALSWLATGDPDAVVIGLEEFPEADRPHRITFYAFRLMVGLGTIAAGYAALAILLAIRRRPWSEARWWLRATVALAPAGLIAMEAGWIVTEVGRQPWVVYGVLRTSDAATPLGTMWLPFVAFTVLYLFLGVVVGAVLWRQVKVTT